jgi:drug/metabolite transporter (DMT)-like permease
VQPGPLNSEVYIWAALSGLFEAAYVILLFRAYDIADLSVVYPLSRGIAPLVTWIPGGVFVGDSVTMDHGLAVGAIVIGVFGVGYSAQNRSDRGSVLSGIFLSLATGFMIAGYHLVDRRAMIISNPPNPQEYLFLMHLFLTGFITFWIVCGLRSWDEIFKEWKTNRLGVLIVGLCTPLAYFLIITALRYGNVTYIAAGRNIGIFLSTVVGYLFLKETVTLARLIGVLLIVAGVMGLIIIANHG